MRFIRPVIMLLVAAISLCSSAEPQSAENWKRIENDAIARKFISDCKLGKKCPEPGKFGWEEVKEYQEKVPELRAARDIFEKYDNELRNLLMQDEEYKNASEALQATPPTPRAEKIKAGKTFKETQSSIFKRLEKKSEAYRVARKKREDSLLASNIKSLEYIIDDYKARGEIFPIEWIPEEAHHHGH